MCVCKKLMFYLEKNPFQICLTETKVTKVSHLLSAKSFSVVQIPSLLPLETAGWLTEDQF